MWRRPTPPTKIAAAARSDGGSDDVERAELDADDVEDVSYGILPDPAEEDEEDGPEGELIGVRRPHRRRSAIQVRWQARGGRTTPRELESEQYTIG